MRRIYFAILLLILVLPWINETLNLVKEKPLDGTIIPVEKPDFKIEEWFTSFYQTRSEAYLNEHTGWHNSLVRLNNQINFSLFRKSNINNIVIGKEDYLFELPYIQEVTGKIYTGDAELNALADDIRFVQNYLENRNKILLTVHAPGKASFYFEHIPDRFLKNISSKTDYSTFCSLAKDKELNFIDFNSWCLQLKDTSSVRIFSPQGIHWTQYGMFLCTDSILKYLESNSDYSFPEVQPKLVVSKEIAGDDYDLGYVLNLIKTLPQPELPKLSFDFKDKPGQRSPRLLVIGDSFYWQILRSGLIEKNFPINTFYYYNSTVSGSSPLKMVKDLNLWETLKQYDVFLLLQSQGNYNNPGLGFPAMIKKVITDREKYLQLAGEQIKANIDLQNKVSVLQQSMNVGAEVATKIVADSIADFCFEKIASYKSSMRNSPEWLANLTAKSGESKRTLEDIMQDDSEWLLMQEYFKPASGQK